MVSEGQVRLNGAKLAKPSAQVSPGDVLTFTKARHVHVVRVVDLAERRGPAQEARNLYQDLSGSPERPSRGTNGPRPTKRARRELDALSTKWKSDP